MIRISHPRKILAVCCGVHGTQDGLTASMFVLLPILAQAFGLSYSQVGMLKGAKNLVQGGVELFSGIASDRVGERAVLTFGLVVAGIGYLLLSQAGDLYTIMLCFLLVGLGGAFQHSPASKLVTHAFMVDRRRGALGLYNSAGDAGKLFTTATLSVGIALSVAWQDIAIFFGLVTLACAALTFYALGKLLNVRTGTEHNPTADTQPKIRGWGIRNKQLFSALLLVITLDSIVQAGVLTFIAFVMIEKGFSTYAATMATVVVLVGGMFGKAACGHLSEKLGLRTAFAIVQLASAVGLVLVVLAPGYLAYVLLPFLGVVVQGSTSITYGSVNDLVLPSHTARGFSLMYGLTSLAFLAGPLGFGILGDFMGIEAAILAMALISIVSIPPSLLLPDRPTDPQES